VETRANENAWVENHPYEELAVGQQATLVRQLCWEDIEAFAAVSGDTNPAHLDPEFARDSLFHRVIAHGMWGASLISALLGTEFPGPGTIYLRQDLHFTRPVRLNDSLTVLVTVKSKDEARKRVDLDCQVTNQRGEAVLHGLATVLAPEYKIRRPRLKAPVLQVIDPRARLRQLLSWASSFACLRCAVAHPCDADALGAALEAASLGLIEPILVGPKARLLDLAASLELDLGGVRIDDAPHSNASAARAAELAARGEVALLFKGSLQTEELIQEVGQRASLRTSRRMTHVYRFDVPLYAKPLLISDAAMIVSPTLADKVDIAQNAIDFALRLGIGEPKLAVLAAVEQVRSDMPSTLDAAALCKMADRGQLRNALVDGPLGFDNAISMHAARIKGITSRVAGDADILLVPDLESGNILTKQLEHLGGASGAGVVLGARVPIALASRADSRETRIASIIMAMAQHQLADTRMG